MANESGFRVRVDEQLKKDFLAACRVQDLTASQVIRRFMKNYVTETLSASARQGQQSTPDGNPKQISTE